LRTNSKISGLVYIGLQIAKVHIFSDILGFCSELFGVGGRERQKDARDGRGEIE